MKYVGATTLLLPKRQKEHLRRANCNGKKLHTKFQQAIREHGWEAFEWSILSECKSVDEMLAEERRWIAEFDTRNPERGYNMTKGGCGVVGYKFSEEAKAKISQAGMGRINSEETRKRLSIANKGRKPSEAAIRGVRARVWTAEQRQHLSAIRSAHKVVLSDEGRRAIIAASQRRKTNDKIGKVPHSHLEQIRARRASGETFASIGKSYGVGAPTLFVWLKGRVSL